jgi:hypothetical protein
MTDRQAAAEPASVLMWEARNWPGIEYAVLATTRGRHVARGTVVALWDDRPLRLEYRLRCRLDWTTERLEVRIESDDGHPRLLTLVSTGRGAWSDGHGHPVEALTGCLDVDLQATPMTNTLPICRLGLGVGESQAIRGAYVSVPNLDVAAVEQRYTRLADAGLGPRYRYESGSFHRELVFDPDGLVINYPGLWHRVPRPR